MLPTSHNRAYQDFVTLLTRFSQSLDSQSFKSDRSLVQQQFQDLHNCYKNNIENLNNHDLDQAIALRWQAVQTEVKREFKLLSTDILFLSSARQDATKTKRCSSISQHLTKLIGYCQILLKNNN